MAFVKGINKQVIVAEEGSFGAIAASGGGQQQRRIAATMQLGKDIYDSQEILPSQQQVDSRHGVRRGTGSHQGQLSPGTYGWAMEGLMRNDFAAGVSTGALTNVTAAAGPPGTFTRAAGSFLTDGFKVGDVVRWSGWSTTGTANNARNYRITDLTALIMSTTGTGNEVVAAKAAGDSVTCTVVGKKLFTPDSGQILKSYTVEHWYPDADTAISERFVGVRVASMRFQMPATGLITTDMQLVAQDMQEGTARYFTSPAPISTTRSLAAVSGLVRLNGADVATITGASLAISAAIEANPVMGSDIVPEIYPGMLSFGGQITVLLRDQSMMTAFKNEVEGDLLIFLTSDKTVNSPFTAFSMSRVKFNSAAKSDSDRSIIQTVAFAGLQHISGTGAGTKFEKTTLTIQDSDAV